MQFYQLPARLFCFLRDLLLTIYAIACGELCMLLPVGSGDVQQLFENGFSNTAAFTGANLGCVATQPGCGSSAEQSELLRSISIFPRARSNQRGPIGFHEIPKVPLGNLGKCPVSSCAQPDLCGFLRY